MVIMRSGLDPIFIYMELGFALVALVFCLLTYFRTREAYSLTKHNGIKYFRDAFLFFGFAYLLRFLFSAVFLSRVILEFDPQRNILIPFSIILLGYFSTMSILYMIFSTVWKSIKSNTTIRLAHVLAILVSILGFITGSPIVLLIINMVLIIIAIVLIFSKKDHKNRMNTRILYMLVLLVWVINLFIAGRPFLPRELDQVVQGFALILFMIIYYKVAKWIK
jgi:hypothetical protein